MELNELMWLKDKYGMDLTIEETGDGTYKLSYQGIALGDEKSDASDIDNEMENYFDARRPFNQFELIMFKKYLRMLSGITFDDEKQDAIGYVMSMVAKCERDIEKCGEFYITEDCGYESKQVMEEYSTGRKDRRGLEIKKHRSVIVEEVDIFSALEKFFVDYKIEDSDKQFYHAVSVRKYESEEYALKSSGCADWEEYDRQMRPSRPF